METKKIHKIRGCYFCGTTFQEYADSLAPIHKCTAGLYLSARAMFLHLIEDTSGELRPEQAEEYARAFWRWLLQDGKLIAVLSYFDRYPEQWFSTLFWVVTDYWEERGAAA